MFTICALLTLCSTFCVSACKQYRNSTHHSIPHSTQFVLPSLQNHHLFPVLLCRLTACLRISLKLLYSSTPFQFYTSYVHQPIPQSHLFRSPPSQAHHWQLIQPPSRPPTSSSHKRPPTSSSPKLSWKRIVLSSSTLFSQSSLKYPRPFPFPICKSQQAHSSFRRSSQIYKSYNSIRSSQPIIQVGKKWG